MKNFFNKKEVDVKSLKVLLSVVVAIIVVSCSSDSTNRDDSEIELWPKIEPYESGYLNVSDLHEIYYEICGNPEGKPVFVIHGGPGFGCTPSDRRFFNPEKFNVVLHDQRGAGRSKPRAELTENTTQFLVQDIERLRQQFGLGKIILFGGSWGSTLSLAYAETYPENVEAMVLRAIFLPSHEDDEDFFVSIIPKYFPIQYEHLLNVFPDSMGAPSSKEIYHLLVNSNPNDIRKYAITIDGYEYKASGLYIDEDEFDGYYSVEENIINTISCATIEHFYIGNNCFLEDGQLLKEAYKIKDISTIIINGRYDMPCPPANAYNLHKQLNNSKLIIVEKAGHLSSEKPIQRELLLAMREFE